MRCDQPDLRFSLPFGNLEIVSEPLYTPGSADNACSYTLEFDFCDGDASDFAYGLSTDGVPLSAIVVPRWGLPFATHSAVSWRNRLYLLIGASVACYSLNPFALVRNTRVDDICALGLYVASERDILICHGEMDVTRLSENLDIVWRQSGRDILGGPFVLAPDYVGGDRLQQ
jgi:hypothetical protein